MRNKINKTENRKGKEMRGSIDVVQVLNSDGITTEIFHINDLAIAEDKAKWLTRYHNSKYSVVIKNVLKNRYPALRSK